MFQKVLFVLSMATLIPFQGANAQPQKNHSADPELVAIEALLDQQAEEVLDPQIIAQLASLNEQGVMGRRRPRPPGRPGYPGFGRHPRRIQCVARNARGQRFAADGYVVRDVSRRALRSCRRFSRGIRVKNSCRVIQCRRIR